MQWSGYREVWSHPAVRQASIWGLVGKAPWFGAGILLTLHVVDGLGQTYAAAGLITGVFTVSLGLSSPWRGRLLDTIGLRRTLAPSLIVLPIVFLIAPFANYWVLLVGMTVVGALAVPWFVLTRQMIIAAVPVDHRRTAIALDSILSEVSFIVGPVFAVLAAVWWDTRWALLVFTLLSMVGAAALAWANPPLTPPGTNPANPAPGRRSVRAWMSIPVITTFIASVAVAFALSGMDLSIVAATRDMDATPMLAVVLATWGAGSLIGGLLYGGTRPGTVSLTFLVGGLSVTTLLGALGVTWWLLAALMTVAGLFVAPTLSAASERLSHAVVEEYRGEAFGWQGTCSTIGNAMAPPLVGWTLDHLGWQEGFLVTGGAALALAAVGWCALTVVRRVRRPAA
ncbi:MAG: MFS transporter [Propioniciclava sp.]